MNTLYRTCPNCGANLDPEEKCDCTEATKKREEYLIVCYVAGTNGDCTVLSAFRGDGNQIEQTSFLKDDEAKAVYAKLTNQVL